MKHKLIKLISVIVIAAFASQDLAWGHTKGEGVSTGVETSPTPLSPGQSLRPRAAEEREIFEGDIILHHETGTIRIVKYIEGGIPHCLRVSRDGEKTLEKDDPEKLREAYRTGKISIFRKRSFTIDIKKEGIIKTFIIPADLTKRCCDLGLNIIQVVQDSVDLIKAENFARIKSPKEIGFKSEKFDALARQYPVGLKEALIISFANLLNREATPFPPAPRRALASSVLRPRAAGEKISP